LTSEEFAERYQAGARTLWTLAAGVLGTPEEAEDVLQEAYVAAAAKRDQFRRGTNFLAWVARFVRNLALNERRKRTRRMTKSTAPAEIEAGTLPDPDAGHTRAGAHLPIDERGALLGDQSDFDDQLMAGLRELGEVPRSCLLLRTLLELSYAEIAALLEIPEGTAMSHVHRSRMTLRAKLSGSGGTLGERRGAPAIPTQEWTATNP